jgi:hypothetical protein
MSFRIILGLVFLVTLGSCLLEEEGKNVITVSKEPKPKVSATLEYSFNQGSSFYYPVKDTIWLESDLYFNITSKDFYSSEIFINGGKVLETKERNFKIQRNTLKDGFHDLMVRQTVYSRTGSIADKVNEEFTKVSNNYVISADTDTYVPKITNASIINGSVVLTWNPRNRGNFASFQLTRLSQWSYTPTISYKINDQRVSTFRDSSYVGGREQYRLVLDKGGMMVSGSSDYRIDFSTKPEFELTQISDSRMKLTWQKPFFFNNIKKYTLKREGVIIADNIPSTDLSIEFTGTSLFGQPNSFTLTSVSKVNNNGNPVTNSESEYISIGKKLPFSSAIDRVVYNSNKNTFSMIRTFDAYQDQVSTFDKDFKLLNSQIYSSNLDIAISPNGLHACVIQNGRFTRVDPATFAPLEYITFSSLGINDSGLNKRADYLSYMSNDGFIVFTMSNTYFVVDIINRKVLLSVARNLFSYINNKVDISSDSKYVVIGSKVYELNSGTYSLKFNLPYNENSIVYVASITNSTNLLIATSTNLYLFDCASNTETKSIDFKSSSNGFDQYCFDKHSLNFITPSKDFINIMSGFGGKLKAFQYGPMVMEGGMLFTKQSISYGNNYVTDSF